MSDGEEQMFEDGPEEELQGLNEEEAAQLEAELDEAGAEEGDEEDKEKEEEEEKPPDLPLTEEMVAESLSLLSRIGSGLAHAYVRLDLREKELTDISILHKYIHLRFVDLTKNHVKDISCLNNLSHILTLRVDQNSLDSVKLEELPYLQFASFSKNKIKRLEGINHPMVEQLNMSFNEISIVSGLDPDKLGRLHTLELRGNKLETTAGLVLPQLKNLFLAGNVLKKLEDIDKLTSLATLHLRDNQLESLAGLGASNAELQYINCRGNNIQKIEEIRALSALPSLRALSTAENPVSEDDEYRLDLIYHLPGLTRLDKDEILEDEKQEATDLFKQKEADALAKAQEAMEDQMDEQQAEP